MAILTMPIVVLVVLRIAASIADRRTAERSKRLLAAISTREPRTAGDTERAREMQSEASTTSVSVLTEEAERDQG
jgi:hypothetical protein